MLVAVFVLLWAAGTVLLGMLGIRSFAISLLVALPFAVVCTALIHQRRKSPRGVYEAAGEAPLTPTVASENIALDADTQRLWLRDQRGKTVIVHRSEILAWEHTWRSITNAFGAEFRRENVLQIGLRRMDMPTVRVVFNTHSHLLASTKNYDEATEWHHRLTALTQG